MLDVATTKSGPSSGQRRMSDNDEAKELRKLIKALQQFTLLQPSINAQTIITFLQVALDEGKSVNDYVSITGIPQSTLSRQLNDLGRLNKAREEGLLLIDDRMAPDSLKMRLKVLTPKGRDLVKRVIRVLS